MHRCKTLTPCITWESALLLPTRHKRNITDSKQQPGTVSERTQRAGGKQWPISYTSPSLPTPTPLLSYYIGSLPSCKSWWHNYTQETSQNGLKQEIAMKPAIGLQTKEIIKGHRGAKSKYIPSDLLYFLSTIFHFQPPALSHNCTNFNSGLENFTFNFLLNIPCSKIIGSIWAY